MTTKASNPKDAIGVRKWRYFSTMPLTVISEVGIALLEGAMKYGRHNYRVAGVRASVYVDAAMGHILQWWEGEDIDADSKLSHITKAIASLVVLRDAMIQDMLNDDRPPKANLDKVRNDLQAVVDELFEKYPDPMKPFAAADRFAGAPRFGRTGGLVGEVPPQTTVTIDVLQNDKFDLSNAGEKVILDRLDRPSAPRR